MASRGNRPFKDETRPVFGLEGRRPRRPFCVWLVAGREGQSAIESCVALLLICLLFAGMFQVSQIFAAHEIINYAANCGARAKSVGFNRWMVEKVINTAAIPNAGRLKEPPFVNENAWLRSKVGSQRPGNLWSLLLGATPSSAQYGLERVRIPEYLGAENHSRSLWVLDYEEWQKKTIKHNARGGAGMQVDVEVEQEYPLRFPAHRAFFAADAVKLEGEGSMENHYPLYLDDRDW